MQTKVGALVMAAGKGTRMKSECPKVLHTILEEPMLYFLLDAVSGSGVSGSAVIVGHKGEMVSNYLKTDWPNVDVVWQFEQLGTGHAVQVAREWWCKYDHVIVLNGDIPLMSTESLRDFIDNHITSGADCSLLSFITDEPGAYGRVVRDGVSVSIVEYKDASEAVRKIKEVNAGVYMFRASSLEKVIDNLSNHNMQGEYYLPDVVLLMGRENMKIGAFVASEEELMGVNDAHELSVVSEKLQARIVEKWLEAGVRMSSPHTVVIGPKVTLAQDVELAPCVHLLGATSVGKGCSVGPWCSLRSTTLHENVTFVSNVIAENSEFKSGAKAGPFLYVREGTVVCENAFAGKFVEIKNSTVGRGSKVPHLSYIGDTVIGEETNIGAGTITCNYDGKKKNKTTIGDRVFVGSDTMFVAPVSVGNDATTAAGSTITKGVPEGALAVARAKQVNLEGWTYKKRGGVL